MSPEAGDLLTHEIVPRLRAAVPRCVKTVGAEDHEELVQDAIAAAAQMLHNVEAVGKKVTPGNIAYYTILHMKSGRRSQCRSRADVLATGTQMDHRSSVLSLEEEVGFDEELNEPVVLADLLCCRGDDPSMAASRRIDWQEFLSRNDRRYGVIAKALASGQKPGEVARKNRMSYAQLRWLLLNMEADVSEQMGEYILEAVMEPPHWRSNIKVKSEKAACLADRRRWLS